MFYQHSTVITAKMVNLSLLNLDSFLPFSVIFFNTFAY